MILFPPVGLNELILIAQSYFHAFPPRLPFQPIFYPVLTESYAIQIASTWNTSDKASGFCGFVTRFILDDAFAQRYPVQTVGARSHQELWVPADELIEFNRRIVGQIEVTKAFYGERFTGACDPVHNLPFEIHPYLTQS